MQTLKLMRDLLEAIAWTLGIAENLQNKLLEAQYGERLDIAAAGSAGAG